MTIFRQEKVLDPAEKVSDLDSKSVKPRPTAKQRKVLDFCGETPRTAQEILDMVGVKYHTKTLLSVRFFRAGLPQTSVADDTSGTTSHPYNLTSSDYNSLKNNRNNLTTLQANNLTSLISQIANFCAQWRTLSEIAEHVQRSRQYLRGEVIPQMLDVLERKYDSPTHPKQQYRTKR